MKDDNHGTPVSMDDLLVDTASRWRGFGPAQTLTMFVGGLAFLTASILMFTMTFTYADPLAGTGPPAWRCADPTDAGCTALFNQQLLDRGARTQPPFSGPLPPPAAPTSAAAGGGLAVNASEATTAAGDGSQQQKLSPRSFCDLAPSQYIWIDPGLSLSAEYNLVCGQAWKISLLDTLFFAGFMAGNGLFGGIADRHGRRATLAACATATAAVTALSASPLVRPGPGARGAAAAVATAGVGGESGAAAISSGSASGGGRGYWLHLVLRCLSGMLCAGQSLGGYVLATESVAPAWRGAAGLLTQSFCVLGELLLVALSAAFPAWRSLTLAVAASCACVVALAPLVPESPRWLLLHGRPDEARAALLWVAALNGVHPPLALECTAGGEIRILKPPPPPPPAARHEASPQVVDFRRRNSAGRSEKNVEVEAETAPLAGSGGGFAATAAAATAATEGGGSAVDVGLLTALSHPVTRRLLLSTCFVVFALSVSYYGVTLALGSLVAGSLHLNFLLTAVAELPGYLLLAATTDHPRLGRRGAIAVGTALAGAACLACAFTSGGVLQVALAMVGKLGCSGAWAVGLTFAAELFPTSLRSGALSMASQSGDLGGLVTPVLLLLSPPGPLRRLPFAVMGVMSLAAVALVAKLPETRGMPQLDTFEELLQWLRCHHRHNHHRQHCTAPLPPLPYNSGHGTSSAAAAGVNGVCTILIGDDADGDGSRQPKPLAAAAAARRRPSIDCLAGSGGANGGGKAAGDGRAGGGAWFVSGALGEAEDGAHETRPLLAPVFPSAAGAFTPSDGKRGNHPWSPADDDGAACGGGGSGRGGGGTGCGVTERSGRGSESVTGGGSGRRSGFGDGAAPVQTTAAIGAEGEEGEGSGRRMGRWRRALQLVAVVGSRGGGDPKGGADVPGRPGAARGDV